MLTKVTGVTFSNEDGTSRTRIIASMSESDEIILERDPYNQYDSNAVKVCVKKDEKVAKLIENNEIIKEIYVPGKILNLVVKK